MDIKEHYEHKSPPSIFIMFQWNYEIIWSYSGNELARMYREKPGNYRSEPIEVPIPDYLDKDLTAMYDRRLQNAVS